VATFLPLRAVCVMLTATHNKPSSSAKTQAAARYKDAFQSPPHSLEHDRGRVGYPPALEGSPFGRALLWLVGARSKEQQLHNGASLLYDAVKEAAEDRALHDGALCCGGCGGGGCVVAWCGARRKGRGVLNETHSRTVSKQTRQTTTITITKNSLWPRP
jgi:hypothetical protein